MYYIKLDKNLKINLEFLKFMNNKIIIFYKLITIYLILESKNK